MSFFSNLFSKNKILTPVDLSVLVSDMHSHLLPGLDDGVKTEQESLELIQELFNMGYRKLITTPHIMSDHYKNTPDGILKSLDKVNDAIGKLGIGITLEAAAE